MTERDPLNEALWNLASAMQLVAEYVGDEDKNTKYLDSALVHIVDAIYFIKDYLDKRGLSDG